MQPFAWGSTLRANATGRVRPVACHHSVKIRAEVVDEGVDEIEDGAGIVDVVVAALRGECSDQRVTKSAKRTMMMTASWQRP